MTDVVFTFEVHQPHRLKRSLFWEGKIFRRLSKKELFDYYFDNEGDREIFKRAARKCYFPSNQILLDLIDRHRHDHKPVKVAFSLSGVFLEQCEMFDKDLLETFKQLAQTGKAEFLDQTYYHSIAGLYPDKNEFIEQVQMHRQLIQDLLGYTPTVFENTELLYNNTIAKTVEGMGYKGIYTEGVEKILGGKSPNFLYTPKGCKKIRILLRNYKLTDDVGFRFSARWWPDWPLTAEKYASWLAGTKGEVINIFPDYETFGEHHWPETGIHEFLRHMPERLLQYDNLKMVTPSEAVDRHASAGEIDVPETEFTVSWADIARDSTGWLGNVMQWAYYTSLRRLEPLVKESDDPQWLRLWRDFQTSDHLYYMFTAGGGPGEVHSYFSPYESPMDAFAVAQSLLNDFESRVRAAILTANEPFLFYTGTGKDYYTEVMAWSLYGFIKAVETVDFKALEYHIGNGDFESWIKFSLKDEELAAKFRQIAASKKTKEPLRRAIVAAAKIRYKILSDNVQEATQQF
ncbi:MAG: glycoside hydrolase family 57 protein [Candidatus Bathyarchaeia archaeon]|jgi:alpha-amylase